MKLTLRLILCLLCPSLFAAVGSWNGVAFTAWNGIAQTSWNGTGISCASGSCTPLPISFVAIASTNDTTARSVYRASPNFLIPSNTLIIASVQNTASATVPDCLAFSNANGVVFAKMGSTNFNTLASATHQLSEWGM